MSADAAGFDVVCLGEPLLEMNLQPADAAGRRLYAEAHGGDASNVAVAAARQGARTAFLSAVGDDPAGRSFLRLWAAEGIDAGAVQVDPDHPTGLYFVTHDAAGHHFSYLRRGSAASRYRLDAAGRGAVARSRILFASGISLGVSDRAADAVFEAADLARGSGARIAIDSNYRPKLWPRRRAAAVIFEAMRLADVAFPGLDDMRLLLDDEAADPDAVADVCLALGPRAVVLKMGAQGALLATPDRRRRVAPFPCRPRDATGAGDVFCGTFLAGLARGDDLDGAAAHAACAAALATEGFGAVPPIPTRAAVVSALAREG